MLIAQGISIVKRAGMIPGDGTVVVALSRAIIQLR